MKNIIKIFYLLLLICLLVINTSSCDFFKAKFKPTTTDIAPQEIYHKAWKIVKDEFFDPDYNNTDWNYWEHRYDNVLKTNEDAYVAIQTMLESLSDKYTRLLTPDKFHEQDIDIEAEISGVGIQIAEKDNKILIVSVLDGTPAKMANLKPEDQIIFVGDKSTKGLDLKDVADLIRGKVGTYVKITIKRADQTIVYNVKRDVIKIKSVKQEMLENNISYIVLDSFISQNAGIEMEEAVIKSENADAFILDIRSNHGGLLPNAISIANIFIDKGAIIVSIIDRNGKKRDFHSITKSITDKPLIVLINGTSASASEILGGALKDHHRAILVGEKTYGKGLVQKIFDLPDGSGVNVTVSKYLTPNGTDIDKKGITPDVEVDFTIEDFRSKYDVQLEEAKKIALQAIKAKRLASKN